VENEGAIKDLLLRREDHGVSAVVDGLGGHHADARVAVLGVVPMEERPAVAAPMLQGAEAFRKIWPVL
jgi:hypothetical protein